MMINVVTLMMIAWLVAAFPAAASTENVTLSSAGGRVSNGAWSITFDAVDTETDKDRRADCHPTDTWWLEFRQTEKLLARKLICSTYSIGPEIIIDRKGNPFVLMNVNEGRGSGARARFLVISVWNGVTLQDVQRIWLGESMTPFLAFDYPVEIETPRAGGLVLRLNLNVEGQTDPDWPTPRSVPRRMEFRVFYD